MIKKLLMTTALVIAASSASAMTLEEANARIAKYQQESQVVFDNLDELQAEIARLEREQQLLQVYINDTSSQIHDQVRQIAELNKIRYKNFLEVEARYTKTLTDPEPIGSFTVAISGTRVSEDRRSSVGYRAGFRSLLDGSAGAFASIDAVKRADSYELSGSIDIDHNGEIRSSAVSVIDIVEDRNKGVSLIAGVSTNGVDVQPVVGVEVVGRDIGVGVTPIGVNVVERVGKNKADRARYSTNPIVVLFQEVSGQRSALDVLEDDQKREVNRRTWIGRERPMEEVVKVDSADLKIKWYTTNATGDTLFVDANPRWHDNETKELLPGMSYEKPVEKKVKKATKVSEFFGMQRDKEEVMEVDSKGLSAGFLIRTTKGELFKKK
ncbi:MAG: DUF3450 domain-containing protein [Candidatus Thiodiazotropha taylori]|uniref:DUF3450 domain-containing protein n=1 Tax=Candidatus Thiodiazotropha taylori TaxID=2792791 RepID=A0A9E4K9B2_9GAMM|nr:DUF3450 domain-containing protein [Candidatus Thiodiazotropha taylori]MCW4254921.1 DUF3450 domain-containing protein [Candidatus Thiodiazotropha taylori]